MSTSSAPPVPPATIRWEADRGFCTGDWTLAGLETFDQQYAEIRWPPAGQLDGAAIHALDTTGALYLLTLLAEREQAGQPLQLTGLRTEHQELLDLVRERQTAAGEPPPPEPAQSRLERLGRATMARIEQSLAFIAFIGEATLALLRLVRQPGRFRGKSLIGNIEEAGVHALPIIGLLSFLLGIVIAYQGGQLLNTYGANIFIVEMVSLTMLRELAPLIAAIIVAGRTGSAYTAQIGTMQVTEEVDALRTIGIPPMDLLVIPKLLALMIALPLLTVFADALSVFGGMVMAKLMLEVSFTDFLERFPQVVTPFSFLMGVSKAPIFAAIIALVGCYQGFQVRGGADSVGQQTTVSVVQSIFLVIVADAIFSILIGGTGLWR